MAPIYAFGDAGIVSWESMVIAFRCDHVGRDLGAPGKTGAQCVASRRNMRIAGRHIARALGMGQATHQRITVLFLHRMQSLDGLDKYRARSARQHHRGS